MKGCPKATLFLFLYSLFSIPRVQDEAHSKALARQVVLKKN